MTSHRVRAATPASTPATKPKHGQKKSRKAALPKTGEKAVLTPLKALPPPAPIVADDPWQKFVAYALAQRPAEGNTTTLKSALLKANPSLDLPDRRPCSKPYPAVVIDLDGASAAFSPDKLTAPPAGLADGLARLRGQGIVILWISQLPASRAPDVGRALRNAGLDPMGQDQLLLVRNVGDRKQLLRDNANDDVCVVAIAGDKRSDFDELFDYLRNPEAAAGLSMMMGEGWFLVPPLDSSTPSGQ